MESWKWNVAINLLDGKIKLSLLFHFCVHIHVKLYYHNMAYVWLVKQLQTSSKLDKFWCERMKSTHIHLSCGYGIS